MLQIHLKKAKTGRQPCFNDDNFSLAFTLSLILFTLPSIFKLQWGSHILCKFWERPIVLIIGISQLWDIRMRRNEIQKIIQSDLKEKCKLWWKIIVLSYTIFWKWQRSKKFSVSVQQVFTLYCWYFVPFLNADLL